VFFLVPPLARTSRFLVLAEGKPREVDSRKYSTADYIAPRHDSRTSANRRKRKIIGHHIAVRRRGQEDVD
jgi:hypothetical protein